MDGRCEEPDYEMRLFLAPGGQVRLCEDGPRLLKQQSDERQLVKQPRGVAAHRRRAGTPRLEAAERTLPQWLLRGAVTRRNSGRSSAEGSNFAAKGGSFQTVDAGGAMFGCDRGPE
eukprot:gene12079-biopygen7720